MNHATPTHHVPAACTAQVVLEAGCTTGLGGDAFAGRDGAGRIRQFLPAR
ncbi:hypothetical protein [Haloarcula salinisoli]|nr:hypothetical protein [Halomicroarcula salinisoli]